MLKKECPVCGASTYSSGDWYGWTCDCGADLADVPATQAGIKDSGDQDE